MINGKVHIDAVVFEDLVALLKSKSKVLDKKTISLGVLNLEIDEQTKRTLEEEIEQKHKAQIKEFAEKGVQIPNNDVVRIVIKKENEKQEELNKQNEPNKPNELNEPNKPNEPNEPNSKSIDGENDLIIG